MSSGAMDRRSFFRAGLRRLARTMAETAEAAWGAERRLEQPELLRLRPPGAWPEPKFLEKCTKCEECVQACPAQCITRVPEGEPDAGTPILIPSLRACVLCLELTCTRVCTPGALRPLSRAAEVAIGLAEVDPGRCVAYQGQACTICRDVCPTAPKAIELVNGKPVVQAALCTGCGLCEERCPTRPRRAIRVFPAPPPPRYLAGQDRPQDGSLGAAAPQASGEKTCNS